MNTTEKSYTRFEYPTSGIHSKVFATVIDTNSNGPDAADEVLSETWTDGAGRVRFSRVPHTFDGYGQTATWAATVTEYDMLGRVSRQSVPTEVNGSFEPTGDDLTRGWLWSRQEYDWMGRVVKSIPTDSSGSDGKESLISYEGCGCAGGLVTTVQGPLVPRDDDPQTNARRKQKSYEDILGRAFTAETYEWDGTTVYSTVVNTYIGRDQVTLSRQYAGTTSSETYQDTTASYDGHGRTVGQKLPQQDSPGTVFTYNPDGSMLTRTDARGVVTNYAYNNRGLVTGITWDVGSTGVTETAAVGFDYDNLGNRTQMTDGLGTQTYEYDELSRLTAETRSFTDTLANAPSANNSFRLEYTYHLAGQLKSLKDPYGQQINYANDRTGRLSTVTGSSFGGVTSYAYDPAYRAWGGLKHLKFGSANQITIDYNDRLAPMSFVANQISAPTNKLFDKTYDYFADGRISLIDENISLLDKFDRSFSYDHLGRVKDAKSGIEAHGGTETDLTKLPFRQTYSYNAFDNLTGRDSTLWDYGDWGFSYTMSNNRVAGSGYDADGREYSSETDDGDVIFFTYNAAGRIVKTERYYDRYETLLAQTGDGGEAKRSQRTFDTELEQWGDWETVYFITSSVFGRVISEATATGKKRHTYVMGGGMEIARQFVSDSDVETVDFGITDPSGYSSRGSGGIMSPYKQEELDGLGNNVGTFAVPNRPEKIGNTMTPTQGVTFDDVTFGQCQMDGIIVPCSMATRAFRSGAALPEHLAKYQHSKELAIEDLGIGIIMIREVAGSNLRPYDEKKSNDESDIVKVITEEDLIWRWSFYFTDFGFSIHEQLHSFVRAPGQTQDKPRRSRKRKCRQAGKKPSDSNYGADFNHVVDKLKEAGLMGFIDESTIKLNREGVSFDITDREGLLGALRAHTAFARDTIYAGKHISDVGASNIFQVRDFRSFTTGSNTLGLDGTGFIRSLQVVVGPGSFDSDSKDPSKQVAIGWADLDCSNPAQDVISLIKHLSGR